MAVIIWCHKHPKYTGQKRPGVICQACSMVFDIAQRLVQETQNFRASAPDDLRDKSEFRDERECEKMYDPTKRSRERSAGV